MRTWNVLRCALRSAVLGFRLMAPFALAHADTLAIPTSTTNASHESDPAACERQLAITVAGNGLLADLSDAVVRGNFAYCLMRQGLLILNVSPWQQAKYASHLLLPAHPDTVAELIETGPGAPPPVETNVIRFLVGYGHSLDVSGGLALTAMGSQGVEVVDVSDPFQPRWIANLPIGAQCVRIRDSMACILTSSGALHLVDLARIETVAVLDLSVIRPAFASSMDWRGDSVFVACGRNGLYIVDISDRGHPRVAGVYDDSVEVAEVYYDSVQVADVVVGEGKAYFSYYVRIDENTLHGIGVLEVTNGNHPKQTANYVSAHSIDDIALADGRLLVLEPDSLKVLEEDSDGWMTTVGTLKRNADVLAVSHDGVWIGGYDGLLFVDLSDPKSPRADTLSVADPGVTLRGYRLPEFLGGLDLSGSFAFVAARDLGMIAVSLFDPTAPKALARYPVSGSVYRLVTHGGLAFLTGSRIGLEIVDISTPSLPVHCANMAHVPNWAEVRGATDDLLFLAMPDSGLELISVESPQNPRVVSRYPTSGEIVGLAIVQSRLYLATSGAGLQVLDITNPALPRLIGWHAQDKSFEHVVPLRDSLIAVSNGRRLEVLDFTRPDNPRPVTSVEFRERIDAVTAHQDLLLVSLRQHGIRAYCLSAEQELTVVAEYLTPETPWQLHTYGDHIIYVDGYCLMSLAIGEDVPGSMPRPYAR